MSTKLIPIDKLTFADNVRTEACLALPKMVASLRQNGYKENHPLVVSEKPDGSFLVLVGNRRGLGLTWLRDNDRSAYDVAVPTGKVPAIVHKGLSPEEEADIRIDHGPAEDREPLDEWSMFLAVKQLLLLGFTQERIAVKLGLKVGKKGQPNRSWVQPRANLARLPLFVQDEYQKLVTKGLGETPFRTTDIAPLYAAYHTEFTAYPNGDGPEFSAAWTKVMGRTEPEKKGPRPLTPGKAKDIAQVCNSAIVRDCVLVVAGYSERTIPDLDKVGATLEFSYKQLQQIIAHLGQDGYADLCANMMAHKVAQETAVNA